jgi:hypothetical protein
MSGQRSKDNTPQTRKQKGLLARIGRAMAWIGSFFLWFITPTGAAELWEKWMRENEEKEK